MDPIGFSLENFDAIGPLAHHRRRQPDRSVRACWWMAPSWMACTACATALVQYSPQFVRVITEKLLIYALGRGTEYYDMPLVRSIVHEAEKNNYSSHRWCWAW